MRGGIGSLAIKATHIALMMVVSIVLARALGPSEFGIYAFSLVLAETLTVPAQFGTPQLVVRETAKRLVTRDYASVKAVWLWGAGLAAVASVSVNGLVLAVIWSGAVLLEPERLAPVLVGLVIVPLLALARVFSAAIRGLGSVICGQLPHLVIRPLVFLCVVGLLLIIVDDFTFTALSTITLQALVTAGALLIALTALVRIAPPEISRVTGCWHSRGAWFRAALPMLFIAGLQVLNMNMSILMLGFLDSNRAVGTFRAAAQLGTVVVFARQAISQILQPHLARLHAEGDKKRLQAIMTRSAQVVTGVALVLALFLFVFAKPVLDGFFGADYESGHLALRILAVGQFLTAAMGPVVLLLNMTGHEKDSLEGVALAALVNVTLSLSLIPIYGTAGAAAATVGAMIVWNGVLARRVYKRLGLVSLAIPIPGQNKATDGYNS
jgi:O-antigen/teichoic acid export membrane protein